MTDPSNKQTELGLICGANKKDGFEGFIGQSVPMQLVYNLIERAAPSTTSVFITGASGTGKEVAAKAIHDLSRRSKKNFLAINCAAIPSELMESEIFGHVKGAFSGAIGARDGAATLADTGTLFLDELSEMDIKLQAKLLRFVQTGSFQKVGSSQTENVDIRFICSTNRDPIAAIAANRLREDLFYRLNVISIDLPALYQREDDVLLLAHHFLQHFTKLEDKMVVGFSTDAEQLIRSHSWPGNVRQLQNTIHSVVIMAMSPLIDKLDLCRALSIDELEANRITEDPSQPSSITNREPKQIQTLAEIEKTAIQHAITICNDNVVVAAGYLEVSPSTLYRKIQSWKS